MDRWMRRVGGWGQKGAVQTRGWGWREVEGSDPQGKVFWQAAPELAHNRRQQWPVQPCQGAIRVSSLPIKSSSLTLSTHPPQLYVPFPNILHFILSLALFVFFISNPDVKIHMCGLLFSRIKQIPLIPACFKQFCNVFYVTQNTLNSSHIFIRLLAPTMFLWKKPSKNRNTKQVFKATKVLEKRKAMKPKECIVLMGKHWFGLCLSS